MTMMDSYFITELHEIFTAFRKVVYSTLHEMSWRIYIKSIAYLSYQGVSHVNVRAPSRTENTHRFYFTKVENTL